jgi:hypothetical protein
MTAGSSIVAMSSIRPAEQDPALQAEVIESVAFMKKGAKDRHATTELILERIS